MLINQPLRRVARVLCGLVFFCGTTFADDRPAQGSWRDYLIIGETDRGTPWVVCWYTWRDIRISMVLNTTEKPPCPTTMTPSPAHEARAAEWARQRAMAARAQSPR
jgi:hypothetical protein